MTNFDYLLEEEYFTDFVELARVAEKLINFDVSSSVLKCRTAAEIAVKWMYSVDSELVKPYPENFNSLIKAFEFQDLVKKPLMLRLDYIRTLGNVAAHTNKHISFDQAALCLENLFYFFDFIYYCYGDVNREYVAYDFDYSLLTVSEEPKPEVIDKTYDIDIDQLIAENEALKALLSEKREKVQETYVEKPLDLSEYKTRKLYIDVMLLEAGWNEGRNWVNEYKLIDIRDERDRFADYVLFGDDGVPLAIVEAKRTCLGVEKGRHQASLYADSLEKQFNYRPVIFLTNGFETRIIDGKYPERRVSNIYSKRDLEKMRNLYHMRQTMIGVQINSDITDRYYQEAAIRSVCETFEVKNRRKALLVMATGSGKTRTAISIVDVMLRSGWIKNILFLADRTALVRQAKKSFVNLLPNLSSTNLCNEKDNYNANIVFSTYQTMFNMIDTAKDDEGSIFSCGHFDLIFIDEAHRSVYNKYKDIFVYFDAPLIGLTATPKDEIDKNTYDIFELEQGIPTYGYELNQAVTDKYLVDYVPIETKFKFLEEGITYDELSEEDRLEYEDSFIEEDGETPEKISSSALNSWVFNKDTIRQVLSFVMEHALKSDYGTKIGKTIIFAKNHNHAEEIKKRFELEYPDICKHDERFIAVIDNYNKESLDLIDKFSIKDSSPQIAVSVDMLDTGIDVPEILNLVMFKPVYSKAKFWQMIGRGTRLCSGLLDGDDKKEFYFFVFCGIFEFFRMNEGREVPNTIPLQGLIVSLKSQIIYKLQDAAYQTEKLIEFRNRLIDEVVAEIKTVNRDNFAAKLHLKAIDTYSNKDSFYVLTYDNTREITEEIAPLVQLFADDPAAVRFDYLMYGIELAYLQNKKTSRRLSDLRKKADSLLRVAVIRDVMEKSDLLNKICHTNYIDDAGINDFEFIREQLRDLIKFIPKDGRKIFETDFTDELLETSLGFTDDVKGYELPEYRERAASYIRENPNQIAIFKLKTNVPLTPTDVNTLEQIFWRKLGSKDDYIAEVGDRSIGEFIRSIVGLDMNAAKQAFAEFLNDNTMDVSQIYFLNQIVEYIVRNGMLQDLSILQEAPFTDRGNVYNLFPDMNVWNRILNVIDVINENAMA